MKTRYGCLTLLLLFAMIIAPLEWYSDYPGKAGALAVGGLFGLIIIYLNSGFEWLLAKFRERKGPSPNKGHVGDNEG